MSIASSTCSTLQVAYDGRVMTMEQSLDENFRGIQRLLNDLHAAMRADCALVDQEIDDDEDFKEHVLHEDNVHDIISEMRRLLDHLPPMMDLTRGTTPAGCREWYRQHKEQRKLKIAQVKQNHATDMARAKAELKTAMEEAKRE